MQFSWFTVIGIELMCNARMGIVRVGIVLEVDLGYQVMLAL